MPPTTGRKKLTDRATTRESPPLGEPLQNPFEKGDLAEPLSGDLPIDGTLEDPSQTPPQPIANLDPGADLWAQLNQRMSSTLGAAVQLTDSQFHALLERFTVADPHLTVPTVEDP